LNYLFRLLWVIVAFSPGLALAQVQPGATQVPNRVDGYGAPAGASVPVSRPAGETTIDILGSYYQQDGSHGAVEGGRGTEQLTDVTPTIIVNVPLDTVSRLSANVGADFYASASSDRIDFALSTPSAHDTRFHADFGYGREHKHRGTLWGVGAGVSTEYDYRSFNLAASFAKTSRDGNRQLSVAGQVFLDQVTLITPIELRTGVATGRGQDGYGTDTRQTYNFTASYSQVLTQRLQIALSTELVSQNGLLSTPFHRVYFYDNPTANPAPAGSSDAFSPRAASAPKTELLPRSRFKYPVSLRLSYYATDLAQVRAFYRFYNDNFGVQAHTAELELPVKLTPFFVAYPFYRYHRQTAAQYFAPYLGHSISDEYYTSDYDLSAFTAYKVGLGLRYAPLYGLTRFRTPLHDTQGRARLLRLRSLDLRYGRYWRSTDLQAGIVSFALGFAL
jgi:hypothetical protein